MLEIIALIFLTKKIGELAEQKGLKPGRWKLYTVLAWFAAEFAVILILIMILGEDLYILAALLGLAGGYISYLMITKNLESKPDAESELETLANHIE